MLSIDRCRQLLGPAAVGMSDAQIERLRGQLYGLADVTVSVFLEMRRPQSETNVEERP